jgi:hypothetical protein
MREEVSLVKTGKGSINNSPNKMACYRWIE